MTSRPGQRIDRISLRNVIPEVFTADDVAQSQVWLRDIDFVRGNHYLIEASSGSGKTSLCSFIYHNRSDYRGEIFYGDRNARTLSPDDVSELRTRHISLLPQELRLFGELTARENVMLKNRLTDHCTTAEIEAMFERLGISDRIDTPTARLSIGQMQRVAIIRSLCQPFDFILLDEPVSHLDADNNRVVAVLIAEAAERQGASVISTSVGNRLDLPMHNIIRLNL